MPLFDRRAKAGHERQGRGATPGIRGLVGLLVCFLMSGCGTLGTTRSMLSMPSFQEENLPQREIRVVTLTPDERKVPAIRALLQKASEALSDQVGIRLVEQDRKLIEWQSRDANEMLGQMAEIMKDYDKPYDIAIAYQDLNALQVMQHFLIGAWEGAIDDTYRRFIIIRKMNVEALMHEICHAFLFSTLHSGGLMTGLTFYLLPGTVPLNRSIYLLAEDRKEILTNKWRDFSTPPNLSQSHVKNPIALPAVSREGLPRVPSALTSR